ncbi:MAG: hypothetical protein ACREEV_14820 [Dongiaceae bacterium]
MRPTSLLAGAFLALIVLPAFAQEGTPTRIRGTVEKLDGQTLIVKSRENQQLSITLADDLRVSAVAKADLADIKPGDYIGSAAVKGTDGKLHAQEVLIFPEAARGAGEGHRPWDLTPDSTMTNATVAEVVDVAKGRLLKLRYEGGENEIEVPMDAPIVTLAPGDRSLLQPGTMVFIPATKNADGSLAASRIVAGKDGVQPPM